MKKAAFLLIPLLGACGQLVTADCNSDSRELGQRQGRIGATAQGERYAAACPGFDVARYEAGWGDGYGQRPAPVGN